jgi:electron transfer flavoprotein beta subunit
VLSKKSNEDDRAMRILTIARHVPDSRLAVRVKGDGSGIEQDGLKFICDPFDEISIEQAVQIKAARSDVDEVVAITIGPAAAADSLRHALAMGADRAVHVVCENIMPHEEIRMARLCAAAIQSKTQGLPSLGADLILCGARSTDNGTGELGPALAEFLGLPHAGTVTQLAVNDGSVRASSRSVPGGEVVMDVALPAVVTCERGLVEPKHPALPKLMKAKKMPIEAIDAAALVEGDERGLDAGLRKLSAPASRQSCRFLEGAPDEMARELLRLLREEAKAL